MESIPCPVGARNGHLAVPGPGCHADAMTQPANQPQPGGRQTGKLLGPHQPNCAACSRPDLNGNAPITPGRQIPNPESHALPFSAPSFRRPPPLTCSPTRKLDECKAASEGRPAEGAGWRPLAPLAWTLGVVWQWYWVPDARGRTITHATYSLLLYSAVGAVAAS